MRKIKNFLADFTLVCSGVWLAYSYHYSSEAITFWLVFIVPSAL